MALRTPHDHTGRGGFDHHFRSQHLAPFNTLCRAVQGVLAHRCRIPRPEVDVPTRFRHLALEPICRGVRGNGRTVCPVNGARCRIKPHLPARMRLLESCPEVRFPPLGLQLFICCRGEALQPHLLRVQVNEGRCQLCRGRNNKKGGQDQPNDSRVHHGGKLGRAMQPAALRGMGGMYRAAPVCRVVAILVAFLSGVGYLKGDVIDVLPLLSQAHDSTGVTHHVHLYIAYAARPLTGIFFTVQ